MFEIPCWNVNAVRVAFAIDTPRSRDPRLHGQPGITVRDLMLLSVERPFGTLVVPQPLERLADMGSCFTANETLAFAHAIRLVPCFTPERSPEPNGIAKAFVKTFKRDYVRLNLRPDASAVIDALDSWFEDYNKMHPYRALGMRDALTSPVHQGVPTATCPA